MEVIKPLMGVYNMFDRMKKNDQQCPHIVSRLEALQKLVAFVQERQSGQLSEDVSKALEKLNAILVSANELLTNFSKKYPVTQMYKSSDYKSEFDNLNKSLTDAFVTLSGALHVHQERKLDEQEDKLAEQTRKLNEQEVKLAEQEDILQRVESKLAYETRAYYCVLQ
ncbi:mixed lineage kinase domain-like protein [Pagrus major]|uniref:mixed lineage kinase domain-like protein n=1 Tax=Pagrus major TaxID=143350 RepID=UPI003CC86C40